MAWEVVTVFALGNRRAGFPSTVMTRTRIMRSHFMAADWSLGSTAHRLIAVEVGREGVGGVAFCLRDDADLPAVNCYDSDLHQAIDTLSLAIPSRVSVTGLSRLISPWSVRKMTISVY